MRLFEHEGKALLAGAGVPVPQSKLLSGPDMAGLDLEAPVVLKGQVLQGKRGKAGAVRIVKDGANLVMELVSLFSAHVAGEPVAAVLAEELLTIEREMYVSLLWDRGLACPILLVSPQGGVEVESIDLGRFERIPIDPTVGLCSHHVRRVQQVLGAPLRGVEAVVKGLWQVFMANQCMLVEVNPLALCSDGRLVAADAKVEIDDRAASLFPAYEGNRSAQTAYELAATAANAVGVESDGAAVVVASGAGVLMATADALEARGAQLRGILDLGGFPRTQEQSAELFRLVAMLSPRVVLFNFFTQVAPCDDFAEAIVQAEKALQGRVVVRLKGNRAEEGTAILRSAKIPVTSSLEEACGWAAALATQEEA